MSAAAVLITDMAFTQSAVLVNCCHCHRMLPCVACMIALGTCIHELDDPKGLFDLALLDVHCCHQHAVAMLYHLYSDNIDFGDISPTIGHMLTSTY